MHLKDIKDREPDYSFSMMVLLDRLVHLVPPYAELPEFLSALNRLPDSYGIIIFVVGI